MLEARFALSLLLLLVPEPSKALLAHLLRTLDTSIASIEEAQLGITLGTVTLGVGVCGGALNIDL